MAPPERIVAVVAWAMHTLRRYVAFAPETTMVIPDKVQLYVVTCKECHMRIQALLIKLAMYRVVWKQGASAF